jgi:hypothetical protein
MYIEKGREERGREGERGGEGTGGKGRSDL